MSAFDAETAITPGDAPGRWSTRLHAAWQIGDAANGGYALTPVLRALREVARHGDPLSVTTHFLRPTVGDLDGTVSVEPVRIGRTTGVVRGTLAQEGRDRLVVTAVFGDLTTPDTVEAFGPPPPGPDELPPPEACVDRAELAQGVDLPILSRLDVRIHPAHAVAGERSDATIAGWIRLADGGPPSVLTVPLFADAFPPSLYPRLGQVGWVPTVELTVHVRRRPGPGWMRASFECDDLSGGRMIESGTLWDADGHVVARCRQLGLHLPA